MSTPAIIAGDPIVGGCPDHDIPDPSTSAPIKPPTPLPFSAPVVQGLAKSVLIAGKPAALKGASGINLPPHVGLHPKDPFATLRPQRGEVPGGSSTVMFEGQPAAKPSPAPSICTTKGSITGSASTVLIG